MKKQILLFVLASFSFLFSQAQINKGDFLLGGSFGYGNSNQSNSNSSSNANLNPRLGYAIGKNSVVSVILGMNANKSKSQDGNYVAKNNGFSSGISWEKFFSIKDRVGWFTNLYGEYSGSSSKTTTTYLGTTNSTKNTSTGYSAGFNPGIYFMPSSGLLLSANLGGIGYNHSKYKSSNNQSLSSQNDFAVNFLSYFGVGIDFIINKKKS